MASKRQRKIKWEIVGLNSLVLIFVLLLLSYTFIHTGAVLARYIHPWQLGYVAALGIEGLIAVLSWRRAFKAEAAKTVSITLGIVLVISAVANLYEGYAVKEGRELTLSGLGDLDVIQAGVGILVTAVIPFLVFMAGEVMGRGLEELGKFISDAAGTEQVKIEEVPEVIAPQLPECEFCHSPLKDEKPQTRSAHLRYCEVYKSTKTITIPELVHVNGKDSY